MAASVHYAKPIVHVAYQIMVGSFGYCICTAIALLFQLNVESLDSIVTGIKG